MQMMQMPDGQEMQERQCGDGGLRTAAFELIQNTHVTWSPGLEALSSRRTQSRCRVGAGL